MSRKFLAPALVLIMCIGITMTAYASPQTAHLQNQPQFTTNATSKELSIIKTLFSAEEYAELYPDVVKAYGNEEAALWDHFVTHGLSEGRALSKNFHVFAYRAAYEDLQEAFGNDLIAYYIHYATHGMQENRSITTVSKAVNAGITVTGLRGQVIAKPVPVEITPTEDTNYEETDTSVAIPESPSPEPAIPAPPAPEPVPTPPVTVCTHQYIIKGLENTAIHALVCELCGDIDESTQETCTADGYEADLMYHHQKCQKCSRIMFTQTHSYTDSTCTICGYQCEHKFLLSSYNSESHRKGCFACGFFTLEPHTPGFCICGYSS